MQTRITEANSGGNCFKPRVDLLRHVHSKGLVTGWETASKRVRLNYSHPFHAASVVRGTERNAWASDSRNPERKVGRLALAVSVFSTVPWE